ncbi:DUF3199 family protein, partial [Bacillus pumilus]|uniref:DUF3199 family protein n=1 Tax=Bacillus pumilus TaxID=1408 RepID=UPI003F68AB4F
MIQPQPPLFHILPHHFSTQKYHPLSQKPRIPLLNIPQYFPMFNHHQSIINPFTSQKIPHYSYPNA